MTPEVLILLGALPESVGTALNELRAKLVKAVLTDAQLATLTGPNGRVRYVGCSTHLGHGRSMEGSMGVQFAFAYVLRHARSQARFTLRSGAAGVRRPSVWRSMRWLHEVSPVSSRGRSRICGGTERRLSIC
jgi:hypothetical protein